ncbi:MAG: hypothetical protein ACRDSH_03190 [Pseudonocardiaceae bacterium]
MPVAITVAITVTAVIPIAAVAIVVMMVIAIVAVVESENFRDSHILLLALFLRTSGEILDVPLCGTSSMARPLRATPPDRQWGYGGHRVSATAGASRV